MTARQWKAAGRRESPPLDLLNHWALAHRAIIAGVLIIVLLLLCFARDIFRPTIINQRRAVDNW